MSKDENCNDEVLVLLKVGKKKKKTSVELLLFSPSFGMVRMGI